MSKLQVIEERKVLEKDFKIYGTKEEPLFLAKDVAEWIDYSFKDSRKINRDVSKMLLTVDDDEKIKSVLNLGGEEYSHGGIRENTEMWFLTEDGLYEVLMQSRKPIAKAFKKEVKTILKQIRQTGGYIPINEEMSEMEIMAKALLISQRTIKKKEELLKIKSAELEEKNKFIGQISSANNSILVRDVAHLVTKNNIKIGERKLWEKLREWGLIFKNSTKPMQRGLEQGLFEVSEFIIQTNHGVSVKHTTRVTGKGQVYIIERLLKEELLNGN